ncbi:MAG TPA: aspartyl protease family protein [Fimbriimonadaceae bacterium]|nr:aspartyl protease family protein [Fimbriimonadaceae bacterium]
MLTSLALVLALRQQTGFYPLTIKMSGPYIAAEVHTKDGKSHLFLVDSGSNESYVFDSAVSDGERRQGQAEIRLDVGPTQVFALAEPAPAAKIATSIAGLDTEGVLGLNLLKQIQLDVDYDADTVSARYGGPLSSPGAGFSPLLMGKDTDGLYTVAGQIGSAHVRLCVDTGASATVLDSSRVDLSAYQVLPSAKLRTFDGGSDAKRYLLDSVKLGDRVYPWMVAYSRPWKTSEEGAIGVDQLGSGHLILDFPGACVYLAASDPVSDSARRVLGLPVRVEGDSLWFGDNLPDRFKSSAGAKIVAIRSTKVADVVAALKGSGSKDAKTLADVYTSIREMGLITTERDGQRQLVPLQIGD